MEWAFRHEFVDSSSNPFQGFPGTAGTDPSLECCSGQLAQEATWLVDIPNCPCPRSVAVISVEVDCDVNVDDISILEMTTEQREVALSLVPQVPDANVDTYSSGMPCVMMLLILRGS